MVMNVAKTKVMLFGEAKKKISIKIHNLDLENVSSFKYLGMMLDLMLDFGMQVDYATGKAKRALNKIGCLIKGRQGISVKMCTDLYKSLIRPHLEYAIPVWANTSDKDLEKLEKVQVDCLRRIIGAILLLQLKLYMGSHPSDFEDASPAADSTSEFRLNVKGMSY